MNLEIILQKKEIKYNEVKSKLREYMENNRFQTFRGFLLYAGLTANKVSKLHALRSDGDLEAEKIFTLLESFKMSLEVKMEEYLLYQDRHDDLKNVKFVDYSNIKFLLAKSNPEIYGNTNSKIVISKNASTEKEFDTTNDSGYSLLGGNLDVDIKKL